MDEMGMDMYEQAYLDANKERRVRDVYRSQRLHEKYQRDKQAKKERSDELRVLRAQLDDERAKEEERQKKKRKEERTAEAVRKQREKEEMFRAQRAADMADGYEEYMRGRMSKDGDDSDMDL